MAGAGKLVHRDERRRRNYPAKRGPLSLQTTEQLLATTMSEMDSTSPPEIAKKVGVGTDGRAVRKVIESAREALARRAEDYVELHYMAALNAAAEGDAKPAQWALERITEAGARIVDSPKVTPTAPSLQIGIAIGGVPQPKQLTTTLPVLTGETAE